MCNQLEKGVLAIFGYTTALSAHALKTYVNLYKVPFISLSPPVSKYIKKTEVKDAIVDDEIGFEFSNEVQMHSQIVKRSVHFESNSDIFDRSNRGTDEAYQLNMFPDMIPLLVSLIKYNRWKTMYYFYNYEEGLDIV